MRIVNATDRTVDYELKAGPLRMTMSTCMLLPSEEEVWHSPYRKHQLAVRCEVHVTVDDAVLVVEADEDATVFIEPEGSGFRLRVA